MNIMEINNYRALIQYDPEIEMFRGEFLGLNAFPYTQVSY